MSPEQIDAKKVNKLTDIYSLGVTLFYMAVGKSPYSDETNSFRIQEKIIREPFPAASKVYPGVSKKMEKIIKKATQKKNKDRYQSCEEFKDDFNTNKRNKKNNKKNLEKKRFKKPGLIVLVSLLLITTLFFDYNKDGISLIQNVIIKKHNISEINFVGDSIYTFNDNTNANGLMYCQYGNIGILKDGKPDGLWTLYYPNGMIRMRVFLVNGKQEGLRTDWYRDGSKEFEGNYLDDKQSGVCRFWYNNGQLELEGEFKKGRFSGDHIRWYKDGSIKYIYDYQKKTYKEYWDNGNIYCDAYNCESPNSPISSFSQGSRQTKFFDKNTGRLINSTQTTKFKEKAINKYSAKDCWFSTTGGELSYNVKNCDFYVYYLNGEIKQFFTDDWEDNGNYSYYENGILSSSWESRGNKFINKQYRRNGSLSYHSVSKHETYEKIRYDFYTEHGIKNKNRLFTRKKLIW